MQALGCPYAAPTHLSGLDSAIDTTIGHDAFMNNPFTGYSEGTFGGCAIQRILSDDPGAPALTWVRVRWAYLGQGSLQSLEDGVCGSAIWKSDGKVVGFFRYAPALGCLLDWCAEGMISVAG